MKEQNKKLDTVIENTASAKSTDIDTEAVKRNTLEKEKQSVAQEAYTQVEIANTKANLENAASLAQSDMASKAYGETEISNANAKTMDVIATEAQTDATREKIFTDEENIAVSQAYTTVASSNASLDLELAAAKGAYTTAEISNARAKELSTVASGEAIFADTALAATEGTATVATNVFSGALVKLGTALKSLATSHPILLAIAAGFAVFKGVSSIIDASTTSIKEQEEAFENANKEYEEAKNNLSSLKNELSSTTDKLTELQDKSNNGTITLVEEDELTKLKETNKELELQIKNQEIIESQKKKEASDEAVKTFNQKNPDANGSTVYETSFNNGEFLTGNFEANATGFEDYDYAINENESKIEEYKNTISNLESDLAKETDETEREIIQNDINHNNDLINNLTSSNEKLASDAKSMAEETFSDKISEYDEYKKTLMQSMNSDGTFDDEEYQKAWDEIQEKEKNLYKFTGRSGEWNEIQFKADIDDSSVKSFFSEIDSKSSTAQKDIEELNRLSEEFNANVNGNVDYSKRPYISPEKMKESGWDDFNAPVATTYSSGYDIEDSNGEIMHIEISPVLPNGDVLSPEELDNYVYDVLEGSSDVLESDKENIVIDFSYDKSKFNDEYYDSLADIKNAHYETMQEFANQLGTDIFNLDINSISDEISKISNNEIITADDVRNSTTFSSYLDKADLSLEDGQDAAEALAKYLNEAKNSASEISDSGAWDDPTSAVDDLDKLKEKADVLSSIQEALDANKSISASTMKDIIEKYPTAKKALSDYMQGIISEQELFNELQGIYENDTTNYINSLVAKSEKDEEFWNNILNGNSQLQEALSSFYGDDYINFTNVADAKGKITQELIRQLTDMWASYFRMVYKGADGLFHVYEQADLMSQAQDLSVDESDSSFANSDYAMTQSLYMPDNSENLNALQALLDSCNNALSEIDTAAYESVKSSLDLSWQGMSGYEPEDSSDSGSDGGSDSGSEPNPKDYDWIENRINAISKAYERLNNVVSDTTRTWEQRNEALVKSMTVLSNEVQAQQQAYDYYMNRFNETVPDGFRELIMNGAIGTSTIEDEGLQDAIDKAQEFYDKAVESGDAVQTLSQELNGLAQTHFDNINSEFEGQLGIISHIITALSNENDLLEAQGYMTSSVLYDYLKQEGEANLNKLQSQRNALINEMNAGLNSGSIEKYSETWYGMQSSINSVSEAIQDATKSLAEYDKAQRQIKWDAFDRERDGYTDLIDETEFMIELLKNEDLTDGNGNLNDNGIATQGLMAQNYQTYRAQAREYADEIEAINAELANDPYNVDLIDRKRELIKAQQDAIKSTYSERDAIKGLISDTYSEYEDSLSKIIDKYKDLMSTIKDAYDYEKNMAEKTKNLASLQKQYAAYQGDTSEEGKKNVQTLKTQISDAESDIKDTEYEKLISDTGKLLDDLQEQVKTEFDSRLDAFESTILPNAFATSNENTGSDGVIYKALAGIADGSGYTMSEDLKGVWASANGGIGEVKTAINNIPDYQEKLGSLGTSLKNIEDNTKALYAFADDKAKDAADELAKQQEDQGVKVDYNTNTTNNDTNTYTPEPSYNEPEPQVSADIGDGNPSVGDVVTLKDGESYYYDSWGTNPSGSLYAGVAGGVVIDGYSNSEYGGENSVTGDYGVHISSADGEYTDLGWVRLDQLEGYRKGTRKADTTNGYAITNEVGNPEIVRTSDGSLLTPIGNGGHVFTSDMGDVLWDFASNPDMFTKGLAVPSTTPTLNGSSNNVTYNVEGITLSMPNITNYEDFCRKAQSDSKFSKMVQEMALGQAMGHNGYSKKLY